MGRRKKLIWFEREAAAGGADRSRRRGAAPVAAPTGVVRADVTAGYYGPMTLDAVDDGVGETEEADPVGTPRG